MLLAGLCSLHLPGNRNSTITHSATACTGHLSLHGSWMSDVNMPLAACACQPTEPSVQHDLAPPAGLRSLHLPGNKLSRLEGLEELTTLRELVLDGNPIKHLDPASFSGGGSMRLVCDVDRCPSHAMADLTKLHL